MMILDAFGDTAYLAGRRPHARPHRYSSWYEQVGRKAERAERKYQVIAEQGGG
jgi:hypothetical protein